MQVSSAQHRLVSSSGNILLRRLASADQQLLERHSELIHFSFGSVVMRTGDLLDHVYFPESAIFSLEEDVSKASGVEVAVIGREGMLGWPALLGCRATTHGAVTQIRSGTAIRIPIASLREASAKSASLWASLLQFIHTVIVQMARSIASHLQDTLDLRLARWLLMRHDRLPGDVLLVRHDQIAESLNVRRASVTDVLHLLEGDRFIRCNRGKILIRDRPGLEGFAGSSYGVPEAHYSNLIAPFGKSRPFTPPIQQAVLSPC